MSVLSIIGPPSEFIKTQFIAKHTTEAEVKIWCGDASQDAVCAYSVMGKLDFFFKKRLTAEETQKSSGHRELLTVKYTLESLGRKLDHKPTHSTVYWLSDSENLVGFLSKGSRRPEIQSLVLEILANARKLQLTIIPIHLRREDPRIQIADAGSKSSIPMTGPLMEQVLKHCKALQGSSRSIFSQMRQMPEYQDFSQIFSHPSAKELTLLLNLGKTSTAGPAHQSN